MLQLLRKRWFLIALAVLIAAGLAIGMQMTRPQLESATSYVPPRLITGMVLLLMSFSLDSRQLKASFRAPRPVVWAASVNYAVIPLMAWPLMRIQLHADYAIGLMIAASVPCTLAAASVWTRKAGGNDAVSLLVTMVTNTLCFLVTPFWLNLTTGEDVALDPRDMVLRLLYVVLVPTLAGQGLRQLPGMDRFATAYKTPIGVVAQAGILSLVFVAACQAGTRLNGDGPSPALGSTVLVWGTCIGVHLTAMLIGVTGARAMNFSVADRAAVAFASSQKTLPIGLYLATDPAMFGNPELMSGQGVPFAVFPMLMYHASQLFIDTAVADRFAAHGEFVA